MATKKQVISYGFMITAPPQVHFAFNPWRFTLTKNNDAADEVATIVFAGETREPYDGAAEFDVQRYVQTKFDGIPDERLKAIDYAQPLAGYGLYAGFGETISLYDADDKLLETHLAMDWFSNEQGWYALWGAISRGEEYGADETLRWWVNYPFTVDFLSLSDEFGIELDAGLPETDPLTGDSLTIWKSFAASGPSVRLFSPSAAWKEATAEGAAEDGDDGDGNASRWPEIMDAASIKVRVSDHVYLKNQDLTEARERTVTLIPDNAPLDLHDHVYLRWVDNLGRIRYHLFTETGQTEAVSASSWNRAEQPEPEIYDSFVNDAQTMRQQLTATRTRTLGAACVDAAEFERLATIARSPIIDVFDGWDDDGNALWHRVNIVAGSYSRDRRHYSDFSFSITDRTQTTQEL